LKANSIEVWRKSLIGHSVVVSRQFHKRDSKPVSNRPTVAWLLDMWYKDASGSLENFCRRNIGWCQTDRIGIDVHLKKEYYSKCDIEIPGCMCL
jgi:hypothetical protein